MTALWVCRDENFWFILLLDLLIIISPMKIEDYASFQTLLRDLFSLDTVYLDTSLYLCLYDEMHLFTD